MRKSLQVIKGLWWWSGRSLDRGKNIPSLPKSFIEVFFRNTLEEGIDSSKQAVYRMSSNKPRAAKGKF